MKLWPPNLQPGGAKSLGSRSSVSPQRKAPNRPTSLACGRAWRKGVNCWNLEKSARSLPSPCPLAALRAHPACDWLKVTQG